MSTPADPQLYESVKRRVYERYPKHSAYRSGHLVREYKESFARKHGATRKPYVGEKKGGLTRWFAERWRNESGGVGYDNNMLYRPTVRVTKDTPKTWSELKPAAIKAAKAEKRKKGRVTRF